MLFVEVFCVLQGLIGVEDVFFFFFFGGGGGGAGLGLRAVDVCLHFRAQGLGRAVWS